MKLRYLINGSETHYVQATIDLVAKTMTGEYVVNGAVDYTHTVDVSSVLNVEPSINPKMEVAKKDQVWDFHLFKNDAYGVEHRKSVGVLVGDDLTATKVHMINDTSSGVTLKNYITHPLDVYDSILSLGEWQFNDSLLEDVQGVTSSTENRPFSTPNGQLKIGYGGDISLDLNGVDPIDSRIIAYSVAMKVDKLGLNDVTNQHQLEMQLGDNIFRFDSVNGITLSNTKGIDTIAQALTSFSVRIVVRETGAVLYLGNQTFTLPNFDFTTLFDRIRLYGFCNTDDHNLIDFVSIHKLSA